MQKIKKSLVFSEMPDSDLAELAIITSRLTFQKGEVIFNQDDEAGGFYLLISGSVRLSATSPSDNKKLLNFASPGETFAEAAFLSDRKFKYEAQALAPGEALYFSKNGFQELIRKNPGLALNLLGHLSFTVRQLSRKLKERTYGDAVARLATFLSGRIAENSTASCGNIYLELGIKKSELASRLGVANETISRSFKKLKNEGILEVRKNNIVIYQPEKLKRLSKPY